MCKLQSQFDFFNQHREEFIREHNGKFVVISKENEYAFYGSRKDAYINGAIKYGLGNFLIQECSYDATEKIELVMPISEIA